MSAPEQKVLPSQITSTAFAAFSPSTWASAARRPERTLAVIVFTGGLLTLMTATSPSRLTRAICGSDMLASGIFDYLVIFR